MNRDQIVTVEEYEVVVEFVQAPDSLEFISTVIKFKESGHEIALGKWSAVELALALGAEIVPGT